MTYMHLFITGILFSSSAGAKDVTIVVYAAYGSPHVVYLNGRVLEKEKRTAPKKDDSLWRRLKRIASDLESDEVPSMQLAWKLGETESSIRTNKEGLFEAAIEAPEGTLFSRLKPPELKLESNDDRYRAEQITLTPVIMARGDLAIISDLDDTIVRTDVTNGMLFFRQFVKNAAQLEPIPGVSTLYRSLNAKTVPVLYLSGSPINLFERMRFYLELHKFPAGPMFLKNLGGRDSDSLFAQKTYKLGHLRKLAKRLPEVEFLCFGVSGEKDADIYSTFRIENPKRVKGVFIRRIPSTAKSEPILKDIHRTEDSFDAARRLVGMGLVPKEKALEIGKEVWGENPIPMAMKLDLEEEALKAKRED
jgi:phosphatidate phosphatase APP1